jgi:hypothetical protein
MAIVVDECGVVKNELGGETGVCCSYRCETGN